jgi:hypothetical protein
MFVALESIFIANEESDWLHKLLHIQKVEPFYLSWLGYSKPLVFLICQSHLFLDAPAIHHSDVHHNWPYGDLPSVQLLIPLFSLLRRLLGRFMSAVKD